MNGERHDSCCNSGVGLIRHGFVNKFTSLARALARKSQPPEVTSTAMEASRKMRFYGIALAASAVVLGACAGGDKGAGDTSAVAVDTSAAAAPVTPAPT